MDYAGNFTRVGDTGGFGIETWGGTTTLSASTLHFDWGSIGEGDIASTLNLPGTVEFDWLGLGSVDNTSSVLDGQTTGTVTVVNDVENRITVRNLALFDVQSIDNYNVIENNTLVNVAEKFDNYGVVANNTLVDVAEKFDNKVGGRVAGSGTIRTVDGFFNEGVIAPGNSIGTLTFVGALTNKFGRFEIEIDPSHYPADPIAGVHNDLVNVISNPVANDGTATINGGFVDVGAPSNDPSVNPTPVRFVGNTQYTFLTTENGLTVNAPLVAVNPANMLLFDFLADHDAMSYWLDIQRQYSYGPFGDTFNQIAIGHYIDDIGSDPNPLGDFFDVLVALDALNAGIPNRTGISDNAKFALDQMSGAIYGTLSQSSIMNTTIVNNTLTDVLRRNTYRGSSASCDPCNPCDPCGVVCGQRGQNRRNAWGLGYGTGGNTKHDGNAYGYDQSFAGTIIGMERASRAARAGVYASYGEGRISSNLFDRSKSKEFLTGLYLRKNVTNGYVLLSGGLGGNQYNTQRTISFVQRRATNKHNAFVGTVYGERGFDIKRGNVTWQPFLGLQYAGNRQESFTEQGAGSLNLLGDATTGHSFRSMLGTRASANVSRSLSLFGQAIWMHEFMNRTCADFTAQFSNPGMVNFNSTSKFTVRGNDPTGSNNDWVVLGTGLNYERRNWRLFSGYDAYVNNRQVLHTGNAGLVFGW
jgi:outer membrane autotransporter protein